MPPTGYPHQPQHQQQPMHEQHAATAAATAAPVGPATSLRRGSTHSSNVRHVQFQATADQRRNIEDTTGIPLVISSKIRSPNRHPRMKIQPYQESDSSNQQTSSYSSSDSSPQEKQQSTLGEAPKSPPSIQQTTSQGNMSVGSPLTFMSMNFSVNTSDSLARYLEGMEDDIVGDVGQEVELVAHAPTLMPSADEHHDESQETILPQPRLPSRRSNIGMSRSTAESMSSSHYLSTPPRPKSKSSRRRRKRSGNHIPSNSGKVQVDWYTPAQASASANPCATTSVCGGMLPMPSPLVARSNRSSQDLSVASPTLMPYPPMSPGSLDLEKMSLCGTENISQGGGSIGGASLLNVFGENDSLIGTGALMDMSMSLGSHPSSGGSLTLPGQRMGLGLGHGPIIAGINQSVFGEQESIDGASALMDLSVGSGSRHGSSSRSGNGSSSRSGRESPASMDKNSGGKTVEVVSGVMAPPPPRNDASRGWISQE